MKIALFGGTFNPIHVGHAIIASHIIQHCDFDSLWLMVSPINPLKASNAGKEQMIERLRMTEMVSHQLDKVITSAFEFQLPRPSYTAETLKALREKFPNDEFSLIIGADNWAIFNHWYHPEEILKHHSILIYPRLGYEVNIPEHLRDTVKEVDAPLIEISSTQIRKDIAEGKNMSFYLPDNVYQYILDHNIYSQHE